MDRSGAKARREVEQRIVLRRWRERIARWRRSGKDELLFCRRERIGLCSFRWWIKELETRDASGSGVATIDPSVSESPLVRGTGALPTPVAERWAKRVNEWRNSGLSQVEFCRRKGLSIYSLRWWKWHLGKAFATAWARAPADRVAPLIRAEKPKFLPVEVVPGPVPRENPPAQRASIDVFLRGKRRIRVVGEFDAQLFSRVVTALEAVP